eukprot:EG_transcript_54007
MHPQQRLALEVAYEALRQAGLGEGEADGLSVTTVAAASGPADVVSVEHQETTGSPYAATGTVSSITANRLAFVFGLQGPSLTIDTACSSSLVAVDVACKAMAHHDSEAALVAGVSTLLNTAY